MSQFKHWAVRYREQVNETKGKGSLSTGKVVKGKKNQKGAFNTALDQAKLNEDDKDKRDHKPKSAGKSASAASQLSTAPKGSKNNAKMRG